MHTAEHLCEASVALQTLQVKIRPSILACQSPLLLPLQELLRIYLLPRVLLYLPSFQALEYLFISVELYPSLSVVCDLVAVLLPVRPRTFA